MLRLTGLPNSWLRVRATVLVVCAVCALATNVATRYGFSGNVGISATRVAYAGPLSPPTRQRLANNAASWLPPARNIAILLLPAGYRPTGDARSSIPTTLLGQIVSNRPPPSSEIHS
jgi:hypothetical protein